MEGGHVDVLYIMYLSITQVDILYLKIIHFGGTLLPCDAVSACLQVNTNEFDLKVKVVWLLYWYAAVTCQNACNAC